MENVSPMVEADMAEVQSYNYAHYVGANALAFRAATSIGAQAPDVTVELLQTGQSLSLSSLWEERELLIEFGSIT